MDTQSSIGEKPAQPLISIIVPVYNVEDFLAECLDSLVNQTLQNIEIVAINDGSTDGSNEILEAYSANYPHLIRVFQRANAGLSAARNFGIDVSTGEYIAFVDSDDWVDLHMFDDMYRRAAETESDIVVCAIAQHAENDDRFRDSRVLHQRWSLADYGQSIAENPSLLLASKSYACNKMFHRSLFAENKHRFPVGQWFEDSATIYPLMYDARRISYVAKRLYNYRVGRPGSITSTLSPKTFDIFRSCDTVLEFYREKMIDSPELYATLEKVIYNHTLVRIDRFERTRWSEKWLAMKYITRAFNYLNTHFPDWKQNREKGRKRRRSSILSAYSSLFLPGKISRSENYRREKKAFKKKRKMAKRPLALQTHGFLVLDDLKKILDDIPISYFADFGTLLGFVRDGGFMPHDLDLDIGAFATEHQKTLVKRALESAGYKIWRTYIYKDRIVEESYLYVNDDVELKFDINYYENSEGYSRTWLFYMDPIIEYATNTRSVVELTYSSIEGTKMIKVDGHSIPVPSDSEKLLEEKYGASWKTPDKDWIYWKSPAARPLDGFGEFY